MKYKLTIEVEADSEFILMYAVSLAEQAIARRGFVTQETDSKELTAQRIRSYGHEPQPALDESNWQYAIVGCCSEQAA